MSLGGIREIRADCSFVQRTGSNRARGWKEREVAVGVSARPVQERTLTLYIERDARVE